MMTIRRTGTSLKRSKRSEPLGLAGFSIDELEVDKSGKFKLGTSQALHTVPDLKIEAKSDLVDASKIVAG